MSTTSTKAGRRRPGRPSQITREAILDAVERHAGTDWTLATIAADLGVTVPAMYHYFPNRDALMKALGQRVLAQEALPPLEGDWRVWLRALAHHWHGLALRHPYLVDANIHLEAFGGAGVDELERPIEALVAEGFSPRDAITAYNLVCTVALDHVRAHLLWQRHRPEIEAHVEALRRRVMPAGVLADVLAQGFSQDAWANLDHSLDMALAGIAAYAPPAANTT